MYKSPVKLHHMSTNIPGVCKFGQERYFIISRSIGMSKHPKLLKGCYKMFVRDV